ncbi:YceI family protein [Ensifer adhaerens]|uniref:YceI family protein n=1 Tax=Ensifer adhaerens TaxID=106592 RepID=UPI00098E944E|nr:YceI family protein [Ensifer adhaerens]
MTLRSQSPTKTIAFTLLLALGSVPSSATAAAPDLADAAGNYGITSASRIHFTVAQAGGGGIVGDFAKFSGNFRIDRNDVGHSTVEFTLYPESVKTGEKRIEDFLKSSAVFDTANYNTVTFRSTNVKQTGPDTAAVEGTLTARGTSRKERFLVTLLDWSRGSIAFNIRGNIHRSPYGMDVGTPIYSNVVQFDMNIKGQRR